MRLTLRTMLAYMDDILEPEDSDDIRKRIDESKFATELTQRIRDCLRRLRLPAPPLGGRGLGSDANSVSEYLDNTLSAERVADFEKICLESNAHLAEVAACHQILTLVLGEPADVDPTLRERMYGLIDQTEESPPVQAPLAPPPVGNGAVAGAPLAVAAKAPPTPRRAKPEVPDYLREDHSRLWLPATAGLIAFVMAMGLFAILMPVEWRETASHWFQGEGDKTPPVTEPAPPTPAEIAEATDHAKNDAAATSDGQTAPKTTAPKTTAPSEAPRANEAGLATPLPGSDAATAAASANSSTAPVLSTVPVPSSVPVTPAVEIGAANSAAASAMRPEPPAASVAVGEKPTTPLSETPALGAGLSPAVSNPAVSNPAVSNPAAMIPAAPGPAVVDGGGAIDIGRYTSEQDVLLGRDVATSTWRRLAPKSAVSVGERLLSLPAFRSTITLVSGVSLQTAGPTDFQFVDIDSRGVPTIAIEYGRLVLFTIGKANNSIRLRFGDRMGLATLVDSGAAIAVEVNRVLPAGQDPEKAPAPLSVQLFAASGSVRWEEGGVAQVIQAPGGRQLAPTSLELPAADAPKWIVGEPLSSSDQRGAAILDRDIPTDRTIVLRLKELSESRLSEVRQLATRCSGYVGEFEPFVHALGEDAQRFDWPKHIETLRAALARSPETAAQIRQVFEKHRGAEAEHLYRMLWSYTPDQLKEGAAALLVEDLNSDSLDTRVLSFWNLNTLTGLSLFYKPEYPLVKRRPNYLKFKERLREGKVIANASKSGPGSAKSEAGKP